MVPSQESERWSVGASSLLANTFVFFRASVSEAAELRYMNTEFTFSQYVDVLQFCFVFLFIYLFIVVDEGHSNWSQ